MPSLASGLGEQPRLQSKDIILDRLPPLHKPVWNWAAVWDETRSCVTRNGDSFAFETIADFQEPSSRRECGGDVIAINIRCQDIHRVTNENPSATRMPLECLRNTLIEKAEAFDGDLPRHGKGCVEDEYRRDIWVILESRVCWQIDVIAVHPQ